MLLPWQKKLGARYGLKRAGNEAAGITGNCFVVLGDGRNMKTLRIVFPALDDGDVEFTEAALREAKIKKFNWYEREIRITFSEYVIPYPPEKIASLIDNLTAHFREKYPQIEQGCHNCGSGEQCGVYTGTGALYLCGTCFSEKEEAFLSARRKYEEAPANYLAGFLGALLFALPGAVLAVLLFVLLDKIAAVSALVCMLLAQTGYKKFRGKVSPAGAVIVSASGIIMIIAGICAGYTVNLIRFLLEEGAPADLILPYLGEFFTYPELITELFGNIAVALLVSAVYIVLNLFGMIKEWRFPLLKKAEDIAG
jgi:hypothetical protein